MHPLISRYLDLSNAVATLDKAAQAVALDADEQAWLTAANAAPKTRDALKKAKAKTAAPSLQQEAIVLAVRAATSRLFADPELGPLATQAVAALTKEGAQPDEAEALVSQVLLEEAFGYAEDPGEFDSSYVAESLRTLQALATVTEERVDGWIERWAKAGEPSGRALRLSVAEALLEAAWSEGPQPIGPEHLDDALDVLGEQVASNELPKAFESLTGFLALLATEQVVGPERLARLTALVKSAAVAGELSDSSEEEADEDADVGEDAE